MVEPWKLDAGVAGRINAAPVDSIVDETYRIEDRTPLFVVFIRLDAPSVHYGLPTGEQLNHDSVECSPMTYQMVRVWEPLQM
jgi:hypothetical protein